ncbi:disease resistance protein RPP5 [Jatropha curcas]|uniref:disease resistance protein RPP5 n=1 Tax=Jatropha curcas TaxID=180498 RepID=UPI001895FAD4|nr:disease resistance protein RPP5 [Jatropha curcas]
MNRIKLLKVYNSGSSVDDELYIRNIEFPANDVHFPEGLVSFPDELRFLRWDFCPLKNLPSKFHVEMLVELNMCGSRIERLWEGMQELPSLKMIKLCYCKDLIEMPDFSGLQILESIDCGGCMNLVEVSPSIGCLKNLHT